MKHTANSFIRTVIMALKLGTACQTQASKTRFDLRQDRVQNTSMYRMKGSVTYTLCSNAIIS